jgi:hypothetical protein
VHDATPNLINRAAIGAYRAAGGGSQRLAAGWKRWLASNTTELKLTMLVVAGLALAGLLS